MLRKSLKKNLTLPAINSSLPKDELPPLQLTEVPLDYEETRSPVQVEARLFKREGFHSVSVQRLQKLARRGRCHLKFLTATMRVAST